MSQFYGLIITLMLRGLHHDRVQSHMDGVQKLRIISKVFEND